MYRQGGEEDSDIRERGLRALATPSVNSPDKFSTPLYTVAEAARYLDVSTSTLRRWAQGYDWTSNGRTAHSDAILTTVKSAARREATIPFVGLAEGLVLAAIRDSGVPLQRIRPALAKLDEELGVHHALASRRLYTDGAEVLMDVSATFDDPNDLKALNELVVVRNGQRVLNEAVCSYLRRLEFGSDGYVGLIHLPAYSVADVVVDPSRGFGQPIFARGGARLEDALALFRAGESVEVVSGEYRVPQADLEDAIRIALLAAA